MRTLSRCHYRWSSCTESRTISMSHECKKQAVFIMNAWCMTMCVLVARDRLSHITHCPLLMTCEASHAAPLISGTALQASESTLICTGRRMARPRSPAKQSRHASLDLLPPNANCHPRRKPGLTKAAKSTAQAPARPPPNPGRWPSRFQISTGEMHRDCRLTSRVCVMRLVGHCRSHTC